MFNRFPFLTDVRYHVLVLFAAVVTSLMCLVALWAAESRRHWFIRFVGLWGALALLLPIRAHEPIVFYAITMGVLIPIRRIILKRGAVPLSATAVMVEPASSTTARRRYSLRDLFLVLTAVGMSLGLAIPVVRADVPWHLFAVFNSSIWIANIANVSAATLGKWRREYWMMVVFLLIFAPLLFTNSVCDWLQIAYLFDIWPRSNVENYLLGFLLLIEIAVGVITGVMVMRSFATWHLAAPNARLARWVAAVGLITVAAPVIWVYWKMLPLPSQVQFLTTNESRESNAFPKIVNAARRLQHARAAEDRQLRDDIERLAREPGHVDLKALRSVYGGLTREEEAKDLRSVERWFALLSEGARQSGKDAEAADFAMLNVLWGDQLGHQGHAMHTLLGAASQNIGIYNLAWVRRNLTSDQARQIAEDLARVDANRESLDELIARDNAWEDTNFRWKYRLERILLREIWGLDAERSVVSDRLEQKALLRRDALLRLMMTDLALRAFQIDRGRLPAALDELVPEYLPAVPIDPYDGRPLRYLAGADDFQLYSVGADDIDDGGRGGTVRQTYLDAGFDLDLEMWAREAAEEARRNPAAPTN